MSQQREFMSDTFHALAQPVTALRATIELALCKEMNPEASHQALEDCLLLVDRLMQDLAIFREFSSLDEPPALENCDGKALLENCVAEMAVVAQESGLTFHLDAEPAPIQCNPPMFQRALFLILDEMIASAPRDSEIHISLCRSADDFLLTFHPGTIPGQRQKLSNKLMRFAGGVDIRTAAESTTCLFRDKSYRRISALTLVDKQVLTAH